MVTRKRHLIAAILLGSYLLANGFAWVHLAHRCGLSHDGGHPAAAVSTCCAHHHGHARQAIEQLIGVAPHDSPGHDQDDCTVCRFQLTKKLAEFVPLTFTSTMVCPEQTALDLPLHRVAPLLATPHSRAPPSLA